ncbi:MAG: hypothetical protein ACRDGO_07055 [Actinomycetota bacterium]
MSKESGQGLPTDGTHHQWGDLIALVIPHGWSAQELGALLEFAPDDQSGAGQISFLRIEAEKLPVSAASALEILEGFERTIDAQPAGPVQVEERLGTVVIRHELTGPFAWRVSVKMWKSGAVVVSYCHAGGNPRAVEQADRLLQSIELIRSP